MKKLDLIRNALTVSNKKLTALTAKIQVSLFEDFKHLIAQQPSEVTQFAATAMWVHVPRTIQPTQEIACEMCVCV